MGTGLRAVRREPPPFISVLGGIGAQKSALSKSNMIRRKTCGVWDALLMRCYYMLAVAAK
jgi:hypothetical protein